MRRTLRYLLWLTGVLLVILMAAPLILPRLISIREHIPEVEAQLSEALDRKVKVDDLVLDLSRGFGFRAVGVLVKAKNSTDDLARLDGVTFVVRPGPLFSEKRIEVAGVLLDHPYLRLEREGGTFNVEDLLGRLPHEKVPDVAPLSLERRLQKALQNTPVDFAQMEGGRVLIIDRPEGVTPEEEGMPALSAGPEVTEFSDLDMKLGSLHPFTPVEFSFSGRVQPGAGRPGGFKLQGSWTFRSEDFDPGQAQLAVRGKFESFDWEWTRGIPAAARLGLEKGRFTGQTSLIGNPFEDFTAEGVVTGTGVRGEWPTLWVVPFEPRTLKLPFEFERHGEFMEIRLKKADINGMDVRSLRIAFALDESPSRGHDFAMDLEVRSADWTKDFEFYPWARHHQSLRNTLRERIARTGGASYVFFTTQGKFKHGELFNDYDIFRVEGDLFGMRMRVGAGEQGPVAQEMTGKFLFENRGIRFQNMDARLDGILPVRFDGGFPAIFENEKLALSLESNMTISEFAKVTPRYAFPALREAFEPLEKGHGRMSAKAKMNFDLASGEFDYTGEMRFQKLAFPLPAAGLDFADLAGEVFFSHESIESGIVRASAGKTPVRFSFKVNSPQTTQPRVEVTFDGEDLALEPILEAWASKLGYRGEGLLSLRNLRVAAAPGTAEPVHIEGGIRLKDTKIFAPYLDQPIEDLNCSLYLAADGTRNDFGCQALFGTSDFKISGAVMDEAGGSLTGRMEADSLYVDVDDLFEKVRWAQLLGSEASPLPPAGDEPRRLEIGREVADGVRLESVEIDRPAEPPRHRMRLERILSIPELTKHGRFEASVKVNSFQLKELHGRRFASNLAIQEGIVNFDELSFEGPGGLYRANHGYLERLPGGAYKATIEPKLVGLAAGPFFTWLGIPEGSIDGQVNLEGLLSVQGKSREDFLRTMGGRILVKAYSGRVVNVKNIKVLAQILTLLRWKGLESYKYGVPFNEISGDFRLQDGVARTDALVFDSPKFSIRTSGNLDFKSQKISMVAHVKISEPLDFAINQIPVVKMLTGKELSLFSIPIPITGSWKAPDLRIGTEGEGVPN